MVGIRSMGLALESLVGVESNGKEYCTLAEWQLKNLVGISNDRFGENGKRIGRFRGLLQVGMGMGGKGKGKGKGKGRRGGGGRMLGRGGRG